MRLPTTFYIFAGLLIGLILVVAAVVPALYKEDATTEPPTDDGDGTGEEVPVWDSEHNYKVKGAIQLSVDSAGNIDAKFMWVEVVRYTPPVIKPPDFPALWMEADYRVKVQFIDPDGKVKEKTVFDDVLKYGEGKTVGFEIDIGHWTKGTLRIVVIRMDGRRFVEDVRNISYAG